jgi:hypothetical protein
MLRRLTQITHRIGGLMRDGPLLIRGKIATSSYLRASSEPHLVLLPRYLPHPQISMIQQSHP